MVEYYRDARDFMGVAGGAVLGRGYGYDSSGYGWATHLSASGATTEAQMTVFGDDYANSTGVEPLGTKIVSFPSGSYYIWLLIGGGSGTPAAAHRVTVGAAPAVSVTSAASAVTPSWKQVGTVAYSVDAGTLILFEFLNPDSYWYSIRAICLKSAVGTPSLIRTGQQGDATI